MPFGITSSLKFQREPFNKCPFGAGSHNVNFKFIQRYELYENIHKKEIRFIAFGRFYFSFIAPNFRNGECRRNYNPPCKSHVGRSYKEN